MTNFFRLILLLLIFVNAPPLFAVQETRLEFRSAAFFPSSKLFREIYGNAGVNFQIEAATELCNFVELWSNLDWFSKKGHSVGFHDPTRVKISNYSLGFNFVYPINCRFALYVGAGPSIGTIWLKNRLHHGKEKTSKTVIGGVFKAGLYLTIDNFFIDLFIDYLYQQSHFHTHVDIGGVKTGAGIGIFF